MRDMVRGTVNMDAARFEKEFPVLSHHLGPENVSLLLRLAEIQELPPGHVLIEDMAPVDAVYLIVSGEVSVKRPHMVLLLLFVTRIWKTLVISLAFGAVAVGGDARSLDSLTSGRARSRFCCANRA